MFTNWTIFEQDLGLKLNPRMKEQLLWYYDFLVAENEKYNLTTITQIDEVFEKHFFDSLTFTQKLKLTNQKLVDLGTGAGFPGVVLKIFFPDLNVTLVESNQKKVYFLEQLIQLLDLKKIQVVNDRAEIFSQTHQEAYDIVISRAVASLSILLEIGAQLVKIKGYFIALKGPKADEEIKVLQNKDQKLGLQLVQKQVLVDQKLGTRINLFYQKTQPTPTQYPRKYSVIKKESQSGRL